MYKNNTNYLFVNEVIYGFITIPEGKIALCVASNDDATTFNIEGQTLVIPSNILRGNIEEVSETSIDQIAMASAIAAEGFSEGFITSFCETAGATRYEGEKALRHWIADLVCDANNTLGKSVSIPKKELFFREPTEEEMKKCNHSIPTLVIEDEDGSAFFLQPFRAYSFQVSSTINGEGDYGSSRVCDLPMLADQKDPEAYLIPQIRWAVESWLEGHAPGCYVNWGWFGASEYGPDEYMPTVRWFHDTVDYLRTRKMGGFKR